LHPTIFIIETGAIGQSIPTIIAITLIYPANELPLLTHDVRDSLPPIKLEIKAC